MAAEESREYIEEILKNEEPIKETVIETIIEEEEFKPKPKSKPKATTKAKPKIKITKEPVEEAIPKIKKNQYLKNNQHQ